jgi:hypothetical protein
MSLRLVSLLALAVQGALGARHMIGDTVKTPFGYVHKDCLIETESGSMVADLGDSVRVTSPSGAVSVLQPCTALPRAQSRYVCARSSYAPAHRSPTAALKSYSNTLPKCVFGWMLLFGLMLCPARRRVP